MKTTAAFLLSCLLVGSVQAAPKKSSQKSKAEESREAASELFSQSKAYYNIHEYQKALDGFKEAYVLSQEPVLLLNMGQCYRYMGQYQDAIVSYQTFLQEDPTTPYAANVGSLIQEMQQKLSELKAPEPVTLPASKEPQPKELPPKMLSDEPYRTPSILYGATAAAFVLGAGAGGLAIVLARKEEEIKSGVGVGDPLANADALEENQQQQKSALGAMIGLGVVSVASATTGVLLFRHHKKHHQEKEIVPIEAILNEPGLVTN
jgi:tetratricopeptide (TPR) repeat protein